MLPGGPWGPAPGMPHPGRPRWSTYPLPQPERTASSAVTSAGGRCASCHFSRSSSSSEAAWPSTERNSCSSRPGEARAADRDRGGGGGAPSLGAADSPREPSRLRSAQAGGTCEPNPAARPRDWGRQAWGPRGGGGPSGQTLTQTCREEGRPCSSRRDLEGVASRLVSDARGTGQPPRPCRKPAGAFKCVR